jgi:hemerythrin
MWNDIYNVGEKSIDTQHRQLFDKINELLAAVRENHSKPEILKTFDYLANYVTLHFSTEEKLMTTHRYPGYAQHKEEHTTFIRAVLGYRKRLEEQGGSAALAVTLQAFLVTWLVDHIGKIDKKLGRFLMEKEQTERSTE